MLKTKLFAACIAKEFILNTSDTIKNTHVSLDLHLNVEKNEYNIRLVTNEHCIELKLETFKQLVITANRFNDLINKVAAGYKTNI